MCQIHTDWCNQNGFLTRYIFIPFQHRLIIINWQVLFSVVQLLHVSIEKEISDKRIYLNKLFSLISGKLPIGSWHGTTASLFCSCFRRLIRCSPWFGWVNGSKIGIFVPVTNDSDKYLRGRDARYCGVESFWKKEKKIHVQEEKRIITWSFWRRRVTRRINLGRFDSMAI